MTTARSKRTTVIAIASSVILIAVIVVGVYLFREDDDAGRNAGSPAADAMAGMDMSGGGEAVLTPQAIATFGITFGNAEERILEAEVRAPAIVVVDESRVVQVAPRFAGFAEQVYVATTGQAVTRGQPLIAAYSPDLLAAQEELLLAQRVGNAMSDGVPGTPGRSMDLAASARQRLLLFGVGAGEVDALVRTGRAQRTLPIRAPISGVVLDKQVVQGQAFGAGQLLYTLADLSQVWVEAEIREADVENVRVGATAVIELAAAPGILHRGRISFIAPVLQGETRTVKARVVLPNRNGTARPGMFASMRISSPTRTALTVPTTAVVNTGERYLIFVDLGNGRLAPREVQAGRVSGDLTEILAGVEPGQRVVTSAQYLLDSESNLADVMRSMISQTGSGEMDMGPQRAPELDEKGADMKGMKMPPRRN